MANEKENKQVWAGLSPCARLRVIDEYMPADIANTFLAQHLRPEYIDVDLEGDYYSGHEVWLWRKIHAITTLKELIQATNTVDSTVSRPVKHLHILFSKMTPWEMLPGDFVPHLEEAMRERRIALLARIIYQSDEYTKLSKVDLERVLDQVKAHCNKRQKTDT